MAGPSRFSLHDLNETVERPFIPDLNEAVERPLLPDLNNPPSPTPFLDAQVTSVDKLKDALAGPSSVGPSSRVGARSSNDVHSGQASLYPSMIASILERVVNHARLGAFEKISTVHVAEEIFSCSLGLLMPPCPNEDHTGDCLSVGYNFTSEINKLGRKFYLIHQPACSQALIRVLNRVAKTHRQQSDMTTQASMVALINSLLNDPTVYRIIANSGFDVYKVKEKVEQVLSNRQER